MLRSLARSKAFTCKRATPTSTRNFTCSAEFTFVLLCFQLNRRGFQFIEFLGPAQFDEPARRLLHRLMTLH